MSRPSLLLVTTVPITLEAFLVPFAKHFRAEGWRVDAMSAGAAGDAALAADFDERFDVAWSRSPLAPGNFVGTPAEVRRVVEAGGYDIVHVHTPVAAFITRFALRGQRRREGRRSVVVYTAHGFHFFRGGPALANSLYRTMERRAARWTDYLVTINEEDFAAAQHLGTIPPGRVRLIPGIGVDTDRYAPAEDPGGAHRAALRSALEVPDDSFMLVMVAELAPLKRHVFVLEALAKADPRAVLVIVGTGPLEMELRGKVEALGLGDRVRFAGYRHDIPDVLAASDALVLASQREGLNRSVLEAMAAGKAVIGTDTRGIADAVGNDAGWIVARNDAGALAAAITQAAEDPAETARRGALGRERAQREFALPRIIRAYEELYGEALASRV